ncbi:DUF2333 family protein [Methylomagnum sp.]
MSVPDTSESPQQASPTGLKGLFARGNLNEKGFLWKVGTGVAFVLLLLYGIGWYWSREPVKFDVVEVAATEANVKNPKELPLGYTYSSTLIEIADTLLHKPGGFLTNDVFPPSVMLDNIPNWELGALIALRDATTALRNHISRAQNQSQEDPDLARGEPFLYFDYKSWQLPSSESEYEKGIESLVNYRERVMKREASFYARADNLRQYLEVLEKRLGDYSNRLGASTSTGGEIAMAQEGAGSDDRRLESARTPWMKIDDRFFEARGYTWAAMHVLKAIAFDFRDILGNKTAMVTLQQVIGELESSQKPFLSPVILNGGGFGLFANYSLTLANYIARANTATIDLRSLLQQG